MKKWWKLILALLIIGASVFAMYYWNQKGREKLRAEEEALKAQAQQIVQIDPKAEMLADGKSYFPIYNQEISMRSVQLQVGDYVGIYIRQPDYEALSGAAITESSQIDTEEDTELASEAVYIPFKLEKLGKFKLAYLGDDRLEIVCSTEEYVELQNNLNRYNSNIVMVMEASDE